MAANATKGELAFGAIAANPTWTTLLAQPTGGLGWVFLMIENGTDKRLDISFDASTEHDSIAAGAARTFDYPWNAAQQGTLSIRPESGSAASGSVYAAGRVL